MGEKCQAKEGSCTKDRDLLKSTKQMDEGVKDGAGTCVWVVFMGKHFTN